MSKLGLHIHKKDSKKSLRKAIVTAVIIILLINTIPFGETKASSKDIQEGIANQIIRFHVIANSDEIEDQSLKLKVKDTVVASMRRVFEDTDSKDKARKKIIENIPKIKKIAEKVIKENGYDYTVSVSLANTYFPTKMYGDMTFPPGIYEALRVKIGGAKGKNWWCVMFPPLCFVDSTYSIVPKDSKQRLEKLLTMEEYNSLIGKEEVKVRIRFKLVDFFRKVFSS